MSCGLCVVPKGAIAQINREIFDIDMFVLSDVFEIICLYVKSFVGLTNLCDIVLRCMCGY